MALMDNGDLVRGLGFVCMYAAWVEEDVEDLLRALEPVQAYHDETKRWPISRKLKARRRTSSAVKERRA